MAGDSATVVAANAEQMVMLRAYLELLQYGQRIQTGMGDRRGDLPVRMARQAFTSLRPHG
jgi:hypothetical protein